MSGLVDMSVIFLLPSTYVKTIIRAVLLQSLGLFLTSQLFSGLVVTGGWTTYLIGGAVLCLLSFALKPLLTLIAFPINLISFGLFTWVINAFLLWVVTVLVAKINVHTFAIHGFSFFGITMPAIHIYSIIAAYIVIGIIISAISWFITWITK